MKPAAEATIQTRTSPCAFLTFDFKTLSSELSHCQGKGMHFLDLLGHLCRLMPFFLQRETPHRLAMLQVRMQWTTCKSSWDAKFNSMTTRTSPRMFRARVLVQLLPQDPLTNWYFQNYSIWSSMGEDRIISRCSTAFSLSTVVATD